MLKKTTGLTGIQVCPNPHYALLAVYYKICQSLRKMPPESAYRKNTEAIVMRRCGIVNQYPKSIADVEKAIGCGQAEELLIQAEKELELVRKMLSWRPWEALIEQPPPQQWSWPPVK